MPNFISVSEESEYALSELLEQHPLIPDADSFIKAYNSGLVNKNNEVIGKIAEAVSKTYKNVELKKNNLVFISEEEMSLSEIAQIVKVWTFAINLKNEVKSIVSEGSLDESSNFVLGDNRESSVAIYSGVKLEDGTNEQLSSRLIQSKDDPKEFLGYLNVDFRESEEGLLLEVTSVMNLDGSVLSRALDAAK